MSNKDTGDFFIGKSYIWTFYPASCFAWLIAWSLSVYPIEWGLS
jgi:hypothetical protein